MSTFVANGSAVGCGGLVDAQVPAEEVTAEAAAAGAGWSALGRPVPPGWDSLAIEAPECGEIGNDPEVSAWARPYFMHVRRGTTDLAEVHQVCPPTPGAGDAHGRAVCTVRVLR